MRTVGKALDPFTKAEPLPSLRQLSRASGLRTATCHRLPTKPALRGLPGQVAPARTHRPGLAVLRPAALRQAALSSRDAAMPVVRRLAEATRETAHLVAGQLLARSFARAARGRVTLRMEGADILPFHAAASGGAGLAFGAETETLIATAPRFRQQCDGIPAVKAKHMMVGDMRGTTG